MMNSTGLVGSHAGANCAATAPPAEIRKTIPLKNARLICISHLLVRSILWWTNILSAPIFLYLQRLHGTINGACATAQGSCLIDHQHRNIGKVEHLVGYRAEQQFADFATAMCANDKLVDAVLLCEPPDNLNWITNDDMV